MRDSMAISRGETCDPARDVRQCLACYLRPRDRLLVAVSGGADSMGLLGMLLALEEYKGRIAVGHVNHRLRETATLDWELVRRFCDTRGVTAGMREVDTRGYARFTRRSIEHAARELRYRELENMRVERGCDWILTAHTMDDSAETVLMRMRNLSPWYEWTGIPERRGIVLRPLIMTKRRSVREWVMQSDTTYREDESNADLKFARNRIRWAVASDGEGWSRERVFTLAECGRSTGEYLASLKSQAIQRVAGSGSSKDTEVCLEIPEILTYYNRLPFVPIEASWARLIGKADARLSSAERRLVNDVLGATTPESKAMLANGVRMIRRGTRVWLERVSNNCSEVPGDDKLPRIAGVELSLQSADVSTSRAANRSQFSGRYRRSDLAIRRWRAGDKIQISGRPRKRVSDILQEMRLSPRAREVAWVISDCEGPIVLLGSMVAERARPQPGENPTWQVSWSTDERK